MYTQLSLENGHPIGVVEGGMFDGKKVRLTKGDQKKNREFVIKDEGKIKPFFTMQLDGEFPNRVQISGPSLCGKSYFARLLAEDYHEQYVKGGDHKIVLFTGIPRHKDNIFACDDCRYMDMEGMKKKKNKKKQCMCSEIYRIRCDESILDDPLELEEMSNSLCIFDDIDRFAEVEISKELNTLRDKIFTSGRHDKISVISIGHILLNGKKTQSALTNCFQMVSFPQTGGRYQLIQFLKRYMSLPKDEIEYIIGLPTRWLVLNNCEPLYVLSEKGCLIL